MNDRPPTAPEAELGAAFTPLPPRSPLREAIGALTRRPEPELLTALLEQARLTPAQAEACLLYTSPSPRDRTRSRMPSSA